MQQTVDQIGALLHPDQDDRAVRALRQPAVEGGLDVAIGESPRFARVLAQRQAAVEAGLAIQGALTSPAEANGPA